MENNIFNMWEVDKAIKYLSTREVAELLEITNLQTIRNWLHGGSFPGAQKTDSGRWLFPEEEVLKVKARIAEIQEKNRTGDLTPADNDDDVEYT